MIRFSFSQIEGKIDCGDCDYKKICSKERHEKKKILSICKYFTRSDNKPKVRITDIDYSQLLDQVSGWKRLAEDIKRKHMAIDWFNSGELSDKYPTFSECLIFIDLNDIFIKYLYEFREMLNNSESILEILLQTVFSVDSETKKVRIYTEDKLLQERMKNYLVTTDYDLVEDKYDNILGIKSGVMRDYIVF